MNNALLERISMNPEILCGKPIIRNLRMKVTDILDMLASGMTNKQILEDFTYLEFEDIYAALVFASLKLNHHTLNNRSKISYAY